MFAQLISPALVGLDCHSVRVEVDLRSGLPAFAIVGLPDAAVQESRERVRSGIVNQGYDLPARRVVVNLAPADLRKAGPQYDLPVALALLAASGQMDRATLAGVGAVGELSLNGSVRAVPGVIAMAEYASRGGWRRLVVPSGNVREASLVEGVECLGVGSLREAVDMLEGRTTRSMEPADAEALLTSSRDEHVLDLEDIRGQGVARRALEIAAAGHHSLLMLGPPGGGKTMLARRLVGILPRLTLGEALAVTRVQSAAGLLPEGTSLVTQRPMRAPHHTISSAGLVGGGRLPRPGELSLAHQGVLFLDEVCAFAPSVLDSIRQPLETGSVDVVRAMTAVRFPAQVLLVCAGNPCPCGHAGDPARECRCAPGRAESYRARLSGPVADRIDLWIDVPRLTAEEILEAPPGDATAIVRERVALARERQRDRGQTAANALLTTAADRTVLQLGLAERRLLARAVDRLGLSARACDRLVRVARTIADLDGRDDVDCGHVGEAVSFRAAFKERGW